jgi:hypothetical protein
LRAGHADVAWTSTLVFVGVELDLQGSSLAAINHRMRQGMAALARWRPVLCCRWLPLARRAQLLPGAVWSSLLWGASTWTPTKAMCSRIASWGARAMATIANLRKVPAEDIGAWWRRLHREGHRLIAKHTVAPELRRKLQCTGGLGIWRARTTTRRLRRPFVAEACSGGAGANGCTLANGQVCIRNDSVPGGGSRRSPSSTATARLSTPATTLAGCCSRKTAPCGSFRRCLSLTSDTGRPLF